MLCLLDDSLELDAVVRDISVHPAHAVLLIPVAGPASLSVCRSAESDDALPFERWLLKFHGTGVLKRGASVPLNTVLLVWRRPDDRLRSVLAALQGLTDTRIDMAFVFAGPLESDASALDAFVQSCSASSSLVWSSIWYLGNGSDVSPVFDATSRRDMLRPLVRVLLSEDGRLTEYLQLFQGDVILRNRDDGFTQTVHADAVQVPAQTAGQCQNVFSAFGLKSWEPWQEEFDADFVRRIAAAVLQCEQQDRAANLPALKKTMTDAAQTLFSTLASLGTPYDASGQGSNGQPFPEQLSPPPEFDFAIVESFPSQESLQPAVEQAIRGHERALLGYRTGLKEELSGLSQQIRRNGRRIFVQALKDARQFIEHTSGLLELWALLKEYFPGVSAAQSAVPLTPSEPASSPAASECHRYGNEAQELLKTECTTMPSAESIRRLQMVAGGMACISILMVLFHAPWTWAWIPAAGGALLVWVLSVHCRRIARRIIDGLVQQFHANGMELRSKYVMKLTWVLQKTQRAVENQLVGEVSAIGCKLGLNHDHFYASGLAAEVEKVSASRIEEMMTLRGVPKAVALSCRQQIEKAVALLIADALKEDAPSVGRVVAQELLDQIATALTQSVALPSPEISTVKAEFLAAAGQREQPPIPARIPTGAASSLFVRHYLLPPAYDGDTAWRSRLPYEGSLGIPTDVRLAYSLLAPLMISRRVGLGLAEVNASLAGLDTTT